MNPQCTGGIHVFINSKQICVCGEERKDLKSLKDWGWVCPMCGKANSPTIAQCHCENIVKTD